MRRMLPFCLAASLFAGMASPASAVELDPPPWWNEARAVLEARGATCEAETFDSRSQPDVMYERPFTRQRFSCTRRVPTAVTDRYGGRLFEGCFSEATDSGQPHLDPYSYDCDIFAAHPGTEAEPNLATWRCARSDGGGQGFDPRFPNIWVAENTGFRRADSLSLDACRAPRAVLDDGTQSVAVALRRGVGVGVTCSDACTVELRATRASAASTPTGVASARLKAGTKRVVRAPIPRGVRSGKLRLLIKVSARGYSKRGRGSATFRGSRLNVNMPASLNLSKQ